MKLKYLLLIGMFLFSLVIATSSSKSYVYTMSDSIAQIFSTLNVNLYQTLNPETVNNENGEYTLCEDDSVNLAKYIKYDSSFPGSLKIKSYCDDGVSIYSCNASAYILSSLSSYNGKTAIITNDEYDTIKDSDLLKFYQPYAALGGNEKSVIDKIATTTGGAWLWRDESGTQIKYAHSYAGMGCYGTYSVTVKKPDGNTVVPPGGGSSLDKFSSANINYKFDQPGEYTVTYTTTIKECIGILKELKKNPDSPTVIHAFKDRKSGAMPFSVSESVKFKVIPIEMPEVDASKPVIDSEIDSNGNIVPTKLVEEEEKTFVIRFNLTNVGKQVVAIKDISYPVDMEKDVNKRIQIRGVKIEKDPKFAEYALQPGGKISVMITATGKPPKDSSGMHTLMINYTYEAKDAGVCGVANAKKTESTTVDIEVVKKEENQRLGLSVGIVPNSITLGNLKAVERNGVTVSGNVWVNPGNIAANGANVTLKRIISKLRDANCVKNCREYEVVCNNTEMKIKADEYGHYSFDSVKLSDECLNVNKVGTLEAEVEAEWNKLRASASGSANVNTATPPPECTLTYKRIFGPTEKYNIKVKINNWNEGYSIKEATYDCGDGSGPKKLSPNSKEEFECNYGPELTQEASRTVIYKRDYSISGRGLSTESMTCKTSVGMCYFQLG